MRFIQVWIMPHERGLEPSVEQKEFTVADRTNRLLRAIGPDREGSSILVHQDASMYLSRLENGISVTHTFRRNFGGYLYLIEGQLALNGNPLGTGDAAMIVDETDLAVAAGADSELIMIEVQIA
jgi:redox-sensitive bicupin YhaK (pirin superfamily)